MGRPWLNRHDTNVLNMDAYMMSRFVLADWRRFMKNLPTRDIAGTEWN